MKWIRVPKCVITIGSFLLLLVGVFCGYKSAESILKSEYESQKTYTPEIQYIDTCKEETFDVGDNKYIITTNTRFLTMQNDGGSHTNIYFEIDLNSNNVSVREDKYVGFKGYDYKRKELKNKKLSDEEAREVKTIIDGLIENPKEIEAGNFSYYTLTVKDKEDIKFDDTTIIDRLNELFK